MDVTMPDGTVIQGVPEGTTKAQLQAKYAAHVSGQPAAAPRWDVLGDIGRAAGDSASALGNDVRSAFPNPMTMDLGPMASLQRMGSALKAPLDAAGVALSPVTGALHGLAGSALSYVLPTPPKDVQTAGQTFYADPKRAADQIIDSSMMGLAPANPSALAAGAGARAAAAADRSQAILGNKAIKKVAERAAADGLNPQDVIAAQQQAASTGDKLTLLDLGDKNVRGLGGAVYRAPGPAGKQVGDFLKGRATDAGGALAGDIQANVGSGSSYHTTQDLIKARSAGSSGLFKDAFASESTAPFEHQFRKALTSATGAKGQIAKQISAIEQNSPGALASRGAAGADVRAKYMDLHEQLRQAEAERESALKVFQKAKADKTADAPGAVWSPRLQQFLDNPEVQSGLKHALKLEKQDAITEGRPFKDTDYSIVGYDEKGDPVLGTVPTMKSLAVAKEGLDARIGEMVDDFGRPTKAGLSLKRFRDAFLGELDTLNPKYKVARDAWGGPSQSMGAVRSGREHFTRKDSNEQIAAEFGKLSPSDKDFYRLGAAEAKVDELERAPDASDMSKRVINNERDRKRFRILFGSDSEAQRFIQSVARKRQAFETKTDVTGGSQTAGRQVEDLDHNLSLGIEGAKTLAHASSFNLLGAASSALRMKRELGLRNNPALNLEIAKLITDPNLMARGRGNDFLMPLPVLPRDNTVRRLLGSELLAAQDGSRSKR